MVSIGSNIAAILGGSDAIDTGALVTQLVAATRTPRQTAITNKQSLNNTRISALASAMGSLGTFEAALKETLGNGTYAGQLASNDPTIVAISALPGGVPQGLPAQIEVQQLASAQTLESAFLAAASDPVGLGTLTLTTASGAHTITIDSTNNSLTGLAAAINGANAGVTASVVVDNRGARLVMKGETGAANAFTLTKEAGDTADAQLATFNFDGTSGGLTRTQTAVDSIVKIDGITHQNDSNELTTALPYVRIDLNKAAPGTLVTLASTEPTTTIKDLLKEFVKAYNTLRSAVNGATRAATDIVSAGALAGDPGMRDMINKLSRLTTTQLTTTGTYQTLSDIGVKTNQDGTLSFDEARFDTVAKVDPQGISQMINPAVSTVGEPGLAKIVTDLKNDVEGANGALATSKAKYNSLAADYTKQLQKLDKEMTDYEARLDTIYTNMGAKLAALKATQSYLNQQISIWNNQKNN